VKLQFGSRTSLSRVDHYRCSFAMNALLRRLNVED